MGTVPMGTVEFRMIASRVASRSPRSKIITVSADHFSSPLELLDLLVGGARHGRGLVALIFVGRPTDRLGSRSWRRWLRLAGITIRPAATSYTWFGVRCGSRPRPDISGVDAQPGRLSWVIGEKPAARRRGSRCRSNPGCGRRIRRRGRRPPRSSSRAGSPTRSARSPAACRGCPASCR